MIQWMYIFGKLYMEFVQGRNTMNDRTFTILCCFITFILSLLSSVIIRMYDNSKLKKERKYNEFYREFYILWNKIHQGRAFDFTDLTEPDRERLIDFFLENYCYAPSEIQDLVYELKTSRFNDFNNGDEICKKRCNECYRKILDYMVVKEQRYRAKYNKVNY